MKTFFNAVLSGKLDYKVEKEYTVTDKDGKVTKMYMSESSATDYATKNPGSNVVATGQTRITPITSVVEGTTGETTVAVPEGKKLGDTFVQNGKIYQVTANNKTSEITPDVDDIWSDNNTKIVAAGETDNAYYKDLVDKRFADLTSVIETINKQQKTQTVDSMAIDLLNKSGTGLGEAYMNLKELAV